MQGNVIYSTKRKFKLHAIAGILAFLSFLALAGSIVFRLYLTSIFPALLLFGAVVMVALDSGFVEFIITDYGMQMPKKSPELGGENFIPFSNIKKVRVNDSIRRIIVETNERTYHIPAEYTNIYWPGIAEALKKIEGRAPIEYSEEPLF